MTTTEQHIAQAILNGTELNQPFRHYTFSNCLPERLANACLQTPMAADEEVHYDGTRAGNSKITPGGKAPSRVFLDKAHCKQHPYFQEIIDAFLSKDVLTAWRNIGIQVEKQFLRIEYIEDRHGFYLEPHKDIVEKTLTYQIYLGDAPAHCGTDLYDNDLKHAKTLTFKHNHAYCFIAGDNTWHGLEAKDIPNKRCSLIVNYVSFATDWPVTFTHEELDQALQTDHA